MKIGHFGIAIRLTNSRFNVCKKWATTLTSEASGVITVPIPEGGAEDGGWMLGKNNLASPDNAVSPSTGGNICRIVLGPSTNSANVGAIEEHQILAGGVGVAGTSVTFTIKQTPLTWLYDVGDPITIIGPGLPHGWAGSSSDDFSFGSILTTDGFVGPYGFEVRDITGSVNNYADFELPKVFPMGAWVRMAVKYKMKNYVRTGGLAGMSLHLTDSSFSVVNDSTGTDVILLMADNTDSYVENSIVFKLPDITNIDIQPYHLLLYFSNFHSADYMKIASISLTHSSYASSLPASGEHDDFSSGYSLIDEYPVLGSVKVKRINDNQKLSKNIDGRFYASNVMDRMIMPVTRYEISYELDTPSFTSTQTIEKLIDFQNRGYLLNHFPQMDGVPHCLTGRLSVKRNKKYHITNLQKQRFTLVFTEVAV